MRPMHSQHTRGQSAQPPAASNQPCKKRTERQVNKTSTRQHVAGEEPRAPMDHNMPKAVSFARLGYSRTPHNNHRCRRAAIPVQAHAPCSSGWRAGAPVGVACVPPSRHGVTRAEQSRAEQSMLQVVPAGASVVGWASLAAALVGRGQRPGGAREVVAIDHVVAAQGRGQARRRGGNAPGPHGRPQCRGHTHSLGPAPGSCSRPQMPAAAAKPQLGCV